MRHEREHHGERDHDDDHEHRERGGASGSAYLSDPGYALYKTECGDCHMAYPPSMLPAASWQDMMGALEDHFGDNAELDAATADQIAAFLDRQRRRRGPRTSTASAPGVRRGTVIRPCASPRPTTSVASTTRSPLRWSRAIRTSAASAAARPATGVPIRGISTSTGSAYRGTAAGTIDAPLFCYWLILSLPRRRNRSR